METEAVWKTQMLQPIGCATLGEDPQSSLSDQCPFGSGGDGGGGGEKK